MRALLSRVLLAAALLGGTVALGGCIVVPPRHAVARVWVPGYWGPSHVWVGGCWRDR